MTNNFVKIQFCQDARGKMLRYGDWVAIPDFNMKSSKICDFAQIHSWDIFTPPNGGQVEFHLNFVNRKLQRFSTQVLKLEQ